MQLSWPAHYLDGRTARRRRATVEPQPRQLRLTLEDGTVLVWSYDELRLTQGRYEGEQVRLERGREASEVVLVEDRQVLSTLRRFAPGLVASVHDPQQRTLRIRLTIYAAMAAAGVVAGLYLWGIPGLAGVVAPHVPVAWEERLGQQVVSTLAPESKRCHEPVRLAAVETLASRLLATVPDNPYTFRVLVVDSPMVNAFAAPGGFVVIFRGLLEETRTPEELAGVLAHEFQHVLQRHVTRAILQEASTGILISAVAGDLSGAMTYGLEVARRLGTLRYSRGHEEEADVMGLRMMVAAHLDPQGMVDFFQTLAAKHPDMPDSLQYLSTHPQTGDRIQTLRRLAAQTSGTPRPGAPGLDWADVRSLCRHASDSAPAR